MNSTPDVVAGTADLPNAPSGQYTRAREILPGALVWVLVSDVPWTLQVLGIDEAEGGQSYTLTGDRFLQGPEYPPIPCEVFIEGNPLVSVRTPQAAD
ncbi:hypothetical protein BJF83_21380 [Nocardiopsis sp. CNR-923]|uniref:hypothetical protein n=1 Tax=Nocardiopsis sp. CNR-923 TaxID=1904965 RepID=UPI00095925D8|nr:hypothetical protein [Nocardiopsis sp. CNR-923]OLT26355.1 hypothetical protein BJF83_21380 [Nocardiopsis sp. CNR-923]